ncbi:Abi family protein [Enterococcus casseliflavus]|uniref:Abi family protein n=1 Tax=Enterococcus casseliflavus TaxID=37734 RepID=A0A415ELS5_ENTCA|nr:Abi family protein [Enterococcus casseliflavus]
MNLRDQCWNLHGDQRENLHSIRMEVFLLKNFEYLHGQIAILNSRGLIVPNYKRAKQYLLTNNYYNIINGYSKYFMNGQNTYIPGATFDEITHLYYFDKEIKYTLFRAITEAENHIKSILAYRFPKFIIINHMHISILIVMITQKHLETWMVNLEY